MRDLPSGTVTFLFTDIEGSTKLLHELGDRYTEAFIEHRRQLREAFVAHDGVEVDTQGDAFFVVFERAKDAVAAAVDVQRSLSSGPVRVRIGVHTGEPALGPEGYVGVDVVRGSRLCSAGHGGQMLVSQTTRDLVEEELPRELALRDLGEHRLRDLTAPRRVYQLLADGLPRDFAPLRTLDSRPTNLPIQPTPLIGREREVRQVGDLLRREEVRLLTLTGPGGCGKTRLALQVAADLLEGFSDGVFFVPLAPVADPEFVLPAAARALGVKESGGRSLYETVAALLAERQVLLVLDSFEHLLEAAPAVGQLLRTAPALNVLVASRTPLHLSGEQEYEVPPLAEYEAVELFVERVRAVEPGFEPSAAVPEICRRLDWLPLAIELAAARVKLLSPEVLLGRLGRRLPLLTRGARDLPERHRTLQATIQWSYELLAPDEQRLFARLAVFPDSCSLEAAEAVCTADLDTLSSLVDKSLVRRSEGRFAMLETIREYALERLEESDEGEKVRQGHADFFVEFAEEMSPTPHRGGRMPEVETERENIRGALAWLRDSEDPASELRLAATLRDFWVARGPLGEGRLWLDDALVRTAGQEDCMRVKAMSGAAWIAFESGDYARATGLTGESLALAQRLDDREGIAFALNDLGRLAAIRGDEIEATRFAEGSAEAWRGLDAPRNLCMALYNVGYSALVRGDLAVARARLEESLEIARELGDESRIAMATLGVGFLYLEQELSNEAFVEFSDGLVRSRELANVAQVVHSLVGLAGVAALCGEGARAARLLGASEGLAQTIGAVLFTGPFERTRREKIVAAVREQLSEEQLAEELDAGATLTEDQAAAYALRAEADAMAP
jgi:predicted ATPase/class 3 adenylate cyclase